MDKQDMGGWAVAGVTFGAGAGIVYGLVQALTVLVAPVGNALVNIVACLLAMLIAALLTIAVVLIILFALRVATVTIIDAVRAQLAKMNADTADNAVDAALFGGLALVAGLVAYLSTGDWLKGNELGLIKGLALFTMVIAACKFLLASGVRSIRRAVIPVLVLACVGIIWFGCYYWTARCANEAGETPLECMLEMHDDLPEHNGENIAKLVAMMKDMGHSLKTIAQKPAASVGTPAAPAGATAVVESTIHVDANEDRPHAREEGKDGTPDGIKQHMFLVTGHVVVFVAALFALAYPFRLAGWKRMLGLGKAV